MTRTVTGLFAETSQARRVVAELEAMGIAPGDIALVSGDGRERLAVAEAASDAKRAAGVGAAAGGVGGLLAGLGIVAVPGLGPVVAAGWAVAALAGATAGAALGGTVGVVAGAITEDGVPPELEGFFAEGILQGGTAVVARIGHPHLDAAAACFERHNALVPFAVGSTDGDSVWHLRDPRGSAARLVPGKA